METFLIRALQLILCFSILIVLHEGGHFLAAKIFKVRVEKFCLFFDPWFTLFKFKPKHSETIYAPDEASPAAVGVSRASRLAAPYHHARGRLRQLYRGPLHLRHDSLRLGRDLHAGREHDLRHAVQRAGAQARLPRRRHSAGHQHREVSELRQQRECRPRLQGTVQLDHGLCPARWQAGVYPSLGRHEHAHDDQIAASVRPDPHPVGGGQRHPLFARHEGRHEGGGPHPRL